MAASAAFGIPEIQGFIAVADAGSFRKAAGLTHVGQSTLSRRVRRLEDNIGVSLFERRSDGVRLTGAGRAFLKPVRNAMAELQHAVLLAGAAGNGAIGHLHLGVITSFSQGPQRLIARAVGEKLPNIDMQIREGDRADLLARLKQRRLDLLVAPGNPSDPDLDTLPLWTEQVVVALPEHHRLATNDQVRWADLQSENFVTTATEPGPEIHEYIVRKIARLGYSPQVARHNVGRETLLNIVGIGLGITIGAESWAGVGYPDVVFRNIVDDYPPLHFTLVWSPENDNPVLRRCLSLARVLAKHDFAPAVLSQSPGQLP